MLRLKVSLTFTVISISIPTMSPLFRKLRLPACSPSR